MRCVVSLPRPNSNSFTSSRPPSIPRGLLNPGKAVPTLARCAEVGGMHVHHGRIAFPEIERF